MTEGGLGFGPNLDRMTDPSIQLQMNIATRHDRRTRARIERNALLTTPLDIERRQSEIRAAALDALGGPLESAALREYESAGVDIVDGIQAESLQLISEGGVRIPATVYRASALVEPAAAVLILPGHTRDGRLMPLMVDYGRRLAARGLVAMCIDSWGQGERSDYLDSSGATEIRPEPPDIISVYEHTYAGVQCWAIGDSIARHFVTDAMVAFDYLAQRADVDEKRIGATGSSGGGALLAWLMMLEPRLAAASPALFPSDRGSILASGVAQDAEQVIVGGTARELDYDEFYIAMAPRPVGVMSGDWDFFPIEGAIDAVRRARSAFRIVGAEEQLTTCGFLWVTG